MDYVFDTSATVVLIETCTLENALTKFSETHKLLVPTKVRDEYLAGDRPERNINKFENLFQQVNVNVQHILLPYFHYDSGSGEINVISHVMQDLSSRCCVIDEEFGRRICKLFDVPVTGSIGIMLEMRKTKLLSARNMNTVRGQIRASSFYLAHQLIDQLR